MILNILLPIILVILLVVPIILQYILKWNLTIISVYGIYLLVYLSIQFLFALINNKYGNRYTKTISVMKSDISCNLMVVGWKEREDYYKMCLESIKTVIMDINVVNRVYIIIDGNDESDYYMVNMAQKIFNNSYEYLQLSDISDETIISVVNRIINKKVIIISHPHSGKRSAMYTGFKLSLLERNLYNEKLETIFCTDSDTVITSESIMGMIQVFKNEMVGAVTGNLSIYNKYDSMMSFMSKIRYWFAFNLERAYQSFSGCVLCVSGPLGMYRLSSVEKILDKWKNQIFFGKKCTYGDDRHLSNLILSTNDKIIYSCNSYAETETPETIYRFYKQQIRWSKSSFREFFWSIKNIDKQSTFMTVDLVYVLIYPYIVMGYMMYLLWYGTLFEFSIYINIVVVLGLIKSLYGVIVSGIYENLFYVLYFVNYISIVFPARLWGLINIGDNSWGTSTRKIGSMDNISLDIMMLILWNLNLLVGFAYMLWRNVVFRVVPVVEWILLGVPLSFIIMGMILIKVYISLRKVVNIKKID